MTIRSVTALLESVSVYSPSRMHDEPKLPRETGDAYEERTWRQRAHVTPGGEVFIPPMSFKFGLDRAARMLGLQIPGKGKATYTKFFESGVMVPPDPIVVAKADQMGREKVHCHANGVRGSGKRVWRFFPRLDSWAAPVNFIVVADEITPEVFRQVIDQAGLVVGVGRFRPENCGYFGRYRVNSLAWH